MEQRLILSGPYAGRVVDSWACKGELWDTVSLEEATRIVNEHNERQARKEQEAPRAGALYLPGGPKITAKPYPPAAEWLCIDSDPALEGMVVDREPFPNGPEFVNVREAARIVREHNERAAREEQEGDLHKLMVWLLEIPLESSPNQIVSAVQLFKGRAAKAEARVRELEQRENDLLARCDEYRRYDKEVKEFARGIAAALKVLPVDWEIEDPDEPAGIPTDMIPDDGDGGYIAIPAGHAGEGDEYFMGDRWWKSGGGSMHPRNPAAFAWRRKVPPEILVPIARIEHDRPQVLASIVRDIQDGAERAGEAGS